MTVLTRIMARLYKLPPAETYDIAVEKGLEVPMLDGVVLRANRFYPRHAQSLPTLLIRTPYGRSNLGLTWGHLFAERGFQVVVQSCRGRDDSGGKFAPFRGEREDGLATLEWLKTQAWFDGRLGMTGQSYMGFTQWAMAPAAGVLLGAISTQITSSEFRSVVYPGESFNFEIFLQWMQVTCSMGAPALDYFRGMLNAGRRLKAGLWHLPLIEADQIVLKVPIQFWRDCMKHTERDDEWWKIEDYSGGVPDVTAPNHLISGWYDFMLPQLLRDYTSLQKAGRKPYLTIGPWSHSSNGLTEAAIRESLSWLRAHLLGETSNLRAFPVRIYIGGVDEWRDLAAWPPADAQIQSWYLQPDASLRKEMPPDSEVSHFCYDPADPTPSVGGAINGVVGMGTGPRDNRRLESRSDVLTFTSLPLEQALEVIGAVTADVFFKSSLGYADVFVRLCDVHPDGRSMNVCDGIQRIFPDRPAPDLDGCCRVHVDLWPTAYRFKRGHCIRVQVSSGAFPRFPRNLGTGKPLATGMAMRVAEQCVYHDPVHLSVIFLSVVSLGT